MSQRDRLLGRKLPFVPYKLLIDDDTAARLELERAETELELAQMGPQDDDAKAEVKKARTRVEKARKAVEACYEPITIRAVTPERFEELVAEHPARPDKDEPYNAGTLARALFLEGVEAELSAEEWETFLVSQVSFGEKDGVSGLLLTALLVNGRTPSGVLPKDWTPTLS